MKRLALTLLVFLALAIGVGYLVAEQEFVDWPVAGGLFFLAVAGEGIRYWLRQKKRASSKI